MRKNEEEPLWSEKKRSAAPISCWFVRHIYEKTGFFTPPYETTASLKKRLKKRYATVTLGTVKSMAWFACRKGLR